MFNKEDERKFHDVIVHSWLDKSFHDRLLSNPGEALKEHGLDAPDYVALKDGTERGKVEVSIPPRPAGVSDDDIKNKKYNSSDICIC